MGHGFFRTRNAIQGSGTSCIDGPPRANQWVVRGGGVGGARCLDITEKKTSRQVTYSPHFLTASITTVLSDRHTTVNFFNTTTATHPYKNIAS